MYDPTQLESCVINLVYTQCHNIRHLNVLLLIIYFLRLQEGEEFLEREAKRAKTDEEGEKKKNAEEAKAED